MGSVGTTLDTHRWGGRGSEHHSPASPVCSEQIPPEDNGRRAGVDFQKLREVLCGVVRSGGAGIRAPSSNAAFGSDQLGDLKWTLQFCTSTSSLVKMQMGTSLSESRSTIREEHSGSSTRLRFLFSYCNQFFQSFKATVDLIAWIQTCRVKEILCPKLLFPSVIDPFFAYTPADPGHRQHCSPTVGRPLAMVLF